MGNDHKDKPSFILYKDMREIFDELSDSDAGTLIKSIFAYTCGEDVSLKGELKFAFMPIKQHLLRDLEKWKNIAERNRENGLLGGRPKKPKKPSGISGNPKKPKKAVNVNVNVNGNVNVSDNDSVIKTQLEIALDEFIKYRKQIRKPLTEHGVKLLINELSKMAKDEEAKVAILNQSIINGWQGVFELKTTTLSKAKKTKGELNNERFEADLRSKGLWDDSINGEDTMLQLQ